MWGGVTQSRGWVLAQLIGLYAASLVVWLASRFVCPRRYGVRTGCGHGLTVYKLERGVKLKARELMQ